MLIVSLPLTAESRVLSAPEEAVGAAGRHPPLRPQQPSCSSGRAPIRFIGSVPLLDIFDKPINDWDSVAKRAFDIVFSIIGIIAVLADHAGDRHRHKTRQQGPVDLQAEAPRLQQRGGRGLQVPLDVCRAIAIRRPATTVTKNDPRVTRVGRFIRKTSIDELPQFFNALFGSLSLVGPRPHAVRGAVAQPALARRWSTAISPATA